MLAVVENFGPVMDQSLEIKKYFVGLWPYKSARSAQNNAV